MKSDTKSMVVLLLLSGVIISLAMGLRQSMGIFMSPVTTGVGISVATFSFSLALTNIVWGLSQPVVGALADRYGARFAIFGTGILYSAGFVLMIYSTTGTGFHLAGALCGIGVAGTGLGILMGVVAKASPPEKRSQRVGAVAAVGSLGTVVLAPFGQWMIDGYGWRAGMVAFACVAALAAFLALFLREQRAVDAQRSATPEPLAQTLRQASKHKGFVAMTTAYFACGFQLIFITTHLPSYLQLCGVSPGVGATALGLIGLFNTLGTYMFGILGARYSQKRLLALIYLCRTIFIGIFLLVPVSATTTLIFASAMGFLWLGVAPLVTGIVSRIFGFTHFNTMYGFVFLSHQVGSFAGAWMGGIVFAMTGKYDLAWLALIAIGATAFTLQWRMDDSPLPARAVPQPA